MQHFDFLCNCFDCCSKIKNVHKQVIVDVLGYYAVCCMLQFLFFNIERVFYFIKTTKKINFFLM